MTTWDELERARLEHLVSQLCITERLTWGHVRIERWEPYYSIHHGGKRENVKTIEEVVTRVTELVREK